MPGITDNQDSKPRLWRVVGRFCIGHVPLVTDQAIFVAKNAVMLTEDEERSNPDRSRWRSGWRRRIKQRLGNSKPGGGVDRALACRAGLSKGRIHLV